MKLSLSCELFALCAGGLHIHCVNKAAWASVWKVRGCLPLLLWGLMRWLRQRQGHDVNSWSITVERGVSPQRRLTEFDKAVSAERLRGESLAQLQEPWLCVWMHISSIDKR